MLTVEKLYLSIFTISTINWYKGRSFCEPLNLASHTIVMGLVCTYGREILCASSKWPPTFSHFEFGWLIKIIAET